MDKKAALLLAFGMAMMANTQQHPLTDEEKKAVKKNRERKKRERLLKKGVKFFTYKTQTGEIEIRARNKKNADKKARKRGCIIEH